MTSATLLLVLVVNEDQAFRRHTNRNISRLVQEPIVGISTAAPVRGTSIERPTEEVKAVLDLFDPHGRGGFALLSGQRDAKNHGCDSGNDQGHTGTTHGVSFLAHEKNGW